MEAQREAARDYSNRGICIPIFQSGKIARLGTHEMWLGAVKYLDDGRSTCVIWDISVKEVVSFVLMEKGLDIAIEITDGKRRGIIVKDESGTILEFAEFSEDGKGLKYPGEYEHIHIDLVKNGNGTQLIRIN